MKGSQFVFESVELLYYSLHKISLNRGGSYVDSPSWIKDKGATINPTIKDNECFKYAVAVALNHEIIKKDPQRISKIKPFIDQYHWKGIEFPSHSEDWKKFQQNKTIALNILFVPYNTKQIRHAYKSKSNHKPDDQIILLIITDGKKCQYLAVKACKGIASNYNGDFYFYIVYIIQNKRKTPKKMKRYAIIMIIVM